MRLRYDRHGTFVIIFHALTVVRIRAGVAEHILECDDFIRQLGFRHFIVVEQLIIRGVPAHI
ncbi:MAG: hypothetical protein ACXV5F_00995 [Halobacteriota archaeon]